MPLGKIRLRPGITVELTPTLNEGGFSVSQLIRFFAGQVQKLGGWTRLPAITPLRGTCSGLFGWADLAGTGYLAAGTEQRLSVISGGVKSDITPIVWTSDIAPAMTTTAASLTVTVTDAGHGPSAGDWVNIVTPVAIGRAVVQGMYLVQDTPSANSYTIVVAAASAAAAGVVAAGPGGAVPVYTATSGLAAVNVLLPYHGLALGASFNARISTTVGGIVVSGIYSVTAVTDINNFRITASALAGSTATVAMNAAHMRVQYLLPSGVARNTTLRGWGVGDWGAGNWGQSNTASLLRLIQRARVWSLDHFGQDLIASPTGGKIYHWSPPVTTTPAVVLDPSAPVNNTTVFAIAQAQIIVAAGSEVGGVHYPTLIRWCDSGNFTAWVASVTNQAGSYQLPTGSYVTGARAVGLGALIWTDVDCWAMTYQGLPYVFGFNQIGTICEAVSLRAPAVIASFAVWPSTRGFRRFTGSGIEPMECPVWDYYQTNLDPMQTDLVFSATNTLFHEVAWYFPMLSGGMGYVKWNYLENVWDYGTLDRTAWTDTTPYGNPTGTDGGGIIYEHENSPDADAMPMISYAQSGYFDLQDGGELQYVNTVIPDFVADAGSIVDLTILSTNYPGQPPRSYGPYAIGTATQRINVSLRARQVAFRVGSSGLGSFWRMGAVRYSASPAGRRP